MLFRSGYPLLHDGQATSGGGVSVAFTMHNDGSLSTTRGSGLYIPGTEVYAGEWLNALVEADVAATFEVMATSTAAGSFTGSAFDTWLSMDTTREWVLGAEPDRVPAQLRIRIRLAATGVVQADKTMDMQVNGPDLGTGGGGG